MKCFVNTFYMVFPITSIKECWGEGDKSTLNERRQLHHDQQPIKRIILLRKKNRR